MAKIRFGDYLKSKERKEAVYESDELIAKRARALIDADSYAVQPKFRVDNYQKAIDLLEQIPDHPDAPGMLAECREGIARAQEDMVRTDFEKGKYHLETASSEHEFKKASEELSAVSDELKQRQNLLGLSPQSSASDGNPYEEMIRETDAMKVHADEQVALYAKKTTRNRWIALIVAIAIVAVAIYAWLSGYGRYLAAKVEGLSGMYESSYSRFYKLGDYLDSRQQYELYKEKYLRQREQEESHALSEADVGDTVSFSGFSWLVLEKNDTLLTLICTAPKEESAFSCIPFDGEQKPLREEMSIEPESDEAEVDSKKSDGKRSEASERNRDDNSKADSSKDDSGKNDDTRETTWANSSLRTYLNEIVLEHEFTPAEIAAMVAQTSGPTKNEQYGTKIEESVEDLLSLLSVEQAQTYQEDGLLKSTSADMWLRTPGHDMRSAAYMTANGNVILYGNDVLDDSLSVCPLILVDYSLLQEDS